MSDSESASAKAPAGELIDGTHEEATAPATPGRKRTPAKPKLDADGNPLPKTPRKTAAPKVKVDAEGNPLPKTPRKQATPKQTKLDADGSPMMATPKKSAGKAKTKAVKAEGSGDEGSGVDSAVAVDGADGAADTADVPIPPTTPASKKRASKAAPDTETPSKRVKGNALPTCKAELSEQDKMLMEWKEEGKSWAEISGEYARITGKPVGKSTLPVRYGRLKASLVELKDGDMERVLIAKDMINKLQAVELEQYKKKQETEVWGRVATHIATVGGDTYTAEAIQKAYAKEKRDNFPHMETDLYAQFLSGGLKADGDSQESAEGDQIKDETEVDFDEDGNPIYTEAQKEAPPTVVKKSSVSDASTTGSVNGSVNDAMRNGSLADILAESASQKSGEQEDDEAVFRD